ncbi:MAG: M13 family metallopeptidase [Bacteroidia bacterium]|nr:M13 family metallopeptidase [Bacteroidia bacterium]
MKNIFFLSLFFSAGLIAQNNYTIGIDLNSMDRSVNPKDDLVRFANGKWLDKTTIPATEFAWGSFSEIKERNETNLRNIILEVAADKKALPATDRKKLQDFYLSAMDSVKLNKDELKNLKGEMTAIDAIKTKAELFKLVARLHKTGVNCFFNFAIMADFKNSNLNRFYLGQTALGLPSRDFYLSENYEQIRTMYTDHMKRTFRLMKFYPESADAYAGRAYYVEKLLAKGCMNQVEMRDVQKQYNKMSVSDLKKIAPSVNITSYFAGLGIKAADTLIITQPEFFKNLSKMIDSVSIADWKLYFKWELVHEMQPYLSDDMVKENFSFYGKVLSGTTEMKPRWKFALASTDAALGDALGKIFVEKHFSAEAKKRVNTMVDNLIAAFKERVKSRPWMSESTKTAAMVKLDKIYRKLGFPDTWEDYSKMDIKPDAFVLNMIRVNKWRMMKMLEKIGKPVDKTKWGMSPPTVNAYYNPSTNEIAFPAGIMQPPFFDPAADDAFNYGMMGAVIGHELSHGFDDQGSQFDAEGNFITWWAKEDVEKFKGLTKGLVSQFSNYIAVDTFHVNGNLTLGENIADLGGLTMAYYAYKKSLNGKASDVREGFTGEQRFFISWAQGWKVKMRDEFMKQLVATNPHSPGYFRALGPPSNMQEFYDAFGIKEGDKMFREKNVRVEIW